MTASGPAYVSDEQAIACGIATLVRDVGIGTATPEQFRCVMRRYRESLGTGEAADAKWERIKFAGLHRGAAASRPGT